MTTNKESKVIRALGSVAAKLQLAGFSLEHMDGLTWIKHDSPEWPERYITRMWVGNVLVDVAVPRSTIMEGCE